MRRQGRKGKVTHPKPHDQWADKPEWMPGPRPELRSFLLCPTDYKQVGVIQRRLMPGPEEALQMGFG